MEKEQSVLTFIANKVWGLAPSHSFGSLITQDLVTRESLVEGHKSAGQLSMSDRGKLSKNMKLTPLEEYK